MFGEAALIQRCQVHKLRNILDHLPERQRPWVKAIVQRAYRQRRRRDGDAAAARIWRDASRTSIPARPGACAKGSTRR